MILDFYYARPEPRRVFSLQAIEGKVQILDPVEQTMAEAVLKEGVVFRAGSRVSYLEASDGRTFLEGCLQQYNGSQFWAEVRKEMTTNETDVTLDELLSVGLTEDEAVDWLTENAFVSAAQRRWYFANLGKKGGPKKGGGGGVAPAPHAGLWNKQPTEVLRWMGKEGWSFADAKKALQERGVDVADATIRAQLHGGKTGARGAPADLTEEQAASLRSAKTGKGVEKQDFETDEQAKARIDREGLEAARKSLKESKTKSKIPRTTLASLKEHGHRFDIRHSQLKGALDQMVKGQKPKRVKKHGMKKAEKMVSVVVDGVRFTFPPDASLRAAATIQGILDMKEGISKALWKANKEIIFSSQRNRSDDYWARAYNSPGFVSVATGGDGKIVVYNSSTLGPGSFAHESGHNLAKKTYGFTDPHEGAAKGAAYAKAQKQEPPVTPYGANSGGEDFAEACKFWVLNRNHLQEKFPQKYAALKELLE